MTRSCRPSARQAVLAGVATAMSLAFPAHAARYEGAWTSGSVSVTCGPGLTLRTCTYDFVASDCTETSVAGATLGPCGVTIHADVWIAPLFNAAGQIVGCQSVSGSVTGYVDYTSTLPAYSQRIDDFFDISVRDVYDDEYPGAIEVAATDEPIGGTANSWWVAGGAFQQTCQRNAGRTDVNSGTAVGSVIVN